jgi:hypothetical protein
MHLPIARPALARDQLLMVIPLSLHFLSNLLFSVIMPCQLGVHLRQWRVLNKVLELEEGMRIGFGKEGNGGTEFSSSTCSSNSVKSVHGRRAMGRITDLCVYLSTSSAICQLSTSAKCQLSTNRRQAKLYW